jgi:hypothetical protein
MPIPVTFGTTIPRCLILRIVSRRTLRCTGDLGMDNLATGPQAEYDSVTMRSFRRNLESLENRDPKHIAMSWIIGTGANVDGEEQTPFPGLDSLLPQGGQDSIPK